MNKPTKDSVEEPAKRRRPKALSHPIVDEHDHAGAITQPADEEPETAPDSESGSGQ